jgi:hypothetical protein
MRMRLAGLLEKDSNTIPQVLLKTRHSRYNSARPEDN